MAGMKMFIIYLLTIWFYYGWYSRKLHTFSILITSLIFSSRHVWYIRVLGSSSSLGIHTHCYAQPSYGMRQHHHLHLQNVFITARVRATFLCSIRSLITTLLCVLLRLLLLIFIFILSLSLNSRSSPISAAKCPNSHPDPVPSAQWSLQLALTLGLS